MNTIRIQQRGTLTLPKKIRESLSLEEGSVLRVSEKNDQIILEKVEGADTELLQSIKESLSDIKNGQFIEFESVPEFKKKLAKYNAR